MILIKGFIPIRILDLLGISGSKLSGVKNRTNNTKNGNKAKTVVLSQISAGRLKPWYCLELNIQAIS